MKPYVHHSFWSDRDIEAQAPAVKLVALWLITNSHTTILGLCDASDRRFSFETGLPKEDLGRACEALPRSFVRIKDTIFIRNFIRHQFGTGGALMRNNFFKALLSEFTAQHEDVRGIISSEYPEFMEALEKGFEGLPKPKDRIGKESTGENAPPDELLNEEQACEQCGNAGVPPDFGRYVFNDWHTRGGKDASGVRVEFIRLAKKRWNREQQEWESGRHQGKRRNGKKEMSV